jgi:hypothetical protein
MRDAHEVGSILHFWLIAGCPKLISSRLSRKDGHDLCRFSAPEYCCSTSDGLTGV